MALKLLNSSKFKDVKYIAPDVSLFVMKKNLTTLNRPIAVGFTILQLGQLLLFKYYYDVFNPLFRNDITLLQAQTDSLTLAIKDPGNDLLQKLKSIGYLIDTSNLAPTHPLKPYGSKHVLPGMLKVKQIVFAFEF